MYQYRKRIKSYISLFVVSHKRLRRNFFFIFLSYLEAKTFLHNNSKISCIFPLYFFLLIFLKPNSGKKVTFQNFFSFLLIFQSLNTHLVESTFVCLRNHVLDLTVKLVFDFLIYWLLGIFECWLGIFFAIYLKKRLFCMSLL